MLKLLIQKEEKRAGNANVEVPTHILAQMQCRNCTLDGKHLQQLNFTFKQGERMEQKNQTMPAHGSISLPLGF